MATQVNFLRTIHPEGDLVNFLRTIHPEGDLVNTSTVERIGWSSILLCLSGCKSLGWCHARGKNQVV